MHCRQGTESLEEAMMRTRRLMIALSETSTLAAALCRRREAARETMRLQSLAKLRKR